MNVIYRLIVAMDNKASLKGMWLHRVTCFKFLRPINITGMPSARAVSYQILYTVRLYQVLQKKL